MSMADKTAFNDDNDLFDDEIKRNPNYVGTYVPTADRHHGAVVYKQIVTDGDQHKPFWLYMKMDSSINFGDVTLADGKITMTNGNVNGTWIIALDKPNPDPGTGLDKEIEQPSLGLDYLQPSPQIKERLLGMLAGPLASALAANCPVNQKVRGPLTRVGNVIKREDFSIKCT